MSGIHTHTQGSMSPMKASGMSPQTAKALDQGASLHLARTTATASHGYPPAQPVAAVPTPTSTLVLSSSNEPPRPQPGAVPAPPPMITAKPTLPPPPKAGEKPQAPKHYAPTHSTPAQPQPYPPQMSQPALGPGPDGQPPGSITSTLMHSSLPASGPPASLPASTETSARASLEHPPGYVQNPYASDMTPDQRFTREQQQNENRSDSIPSLGYNDNAGGKGTTGYGHDESMWDVDKDWGMKKGKQLGDLHEQVWDSIGRK